MSNRKEFNNLDWLRFALAVYIVIYHIWREYSIFTSHGDISRFLGLGNMATSIFFVLSGFLLTHVYVAEKADIKIRKQSFWIARFSTLYPLHIIGLLLTLPSAFNAILKQGGIEVPMESLDVPTRMLGPGETLFAFLSHLTLTHAWNPLYLVFNIPSWSLSALLFFYLLFPYLAPGLVKTKNPYAGLLVLGLLFTVPGAISEIYDYTGMVADGVLHRNPLVRLPLFLAGILLCAIYRREGAMAHAPLNDRAGSLALWAIIGGTILVAAYFYAPGTENRYPLIRNGLFFPSALAVVWLAARENGKISEWNRKWSARLGKASLSIFMLHLPLFLIFTKIEKVIHAYFMSDGGIKNFGALVASARELPPLNELFMVHLVLIIGLSIIFQERIVTPMQHLLRRKLMDKTAPACTIKFGDTTGDIKFR